MSYGMDQLYDGLTPEDVGIESTPAPEEFVEVAENYNFRLIQEFVYYDVVEGHTFAYNDVVITTDYKRNTILVTIKGVTLGSQPLTGIKQFATFMELAGYNVFSGLSD